MADATVFDASRMHEVQNAVSMSMLPLTHVQGVAPVVVGAGAVRTAAQATEDRLTTAALDDGGSCYASKPWKATADDRHGGAGVGWDVGDDFNGVRRVFHA